MKSREEYEASIFAKRDALIAKRKKNIRMVSVALSIMLCIGATAVVLPMFRVIDEAAPPSATNAANSNGITENKFIAEMFDEASTQAAGDVMITEDSDTAVLNGNAEKPESVEEGDAEYFTFYHTFNADGIIQHTPITEIALETEIAIENAEGECPTVNKQFGYDSVQDALAPDVQSTKPSASNKTYTTEEITEAAKNYLSENDTENIIEDKTNSVVSRKSDGTTSYTVYFYTSEKKITVKLSSELALLEIKEKDNSGDTVQISPAYNPDA